MDKLLSNITYHQGNILNSNADIIVQQVNCIGVMGAGLAKQIREVFPDVYTQYRSHCNKYKKEDLLGQVIYTSTKSCENTVLIASIFGQLEIGRNKQYTNYSALDMGLCDIAMKYNSRIIAIPYGLGCGLGGGNWDRVISIIENAFGYTNCKVQIWKFK